MWISALHDFMTSTCESKLQLVEKMQCEQKRLAKQHSPSLILSFAEGLLRNCGAGEIVTAKPKRKCTSNTVVRLVRVH